MEFPRQESWSGLPCPPPGDLPDPEINLTSPMTGTGRFFTHWATGEAPGKQRRMEKNGKTNVAFSGCCGKWVVRCASALEARKAVVTALHSYRSNGHPLLQRDSSCYPLLFLLKNDLPLAWDHNTRASSSVTRHSLSHLLKFHVPGTEIPSF